MLALGSGSYKSSLTYFRFVALLTQLSKYGYDISLVLPSADKYNKYTPDRQASLPGMQLIQPWQPTTKRDIVNLIPYLFTAVVASIKVRPEIIFIDKPTPISIIGLVPKFLFRAPMILDLDDLGSEVMRLQNQSGFQVKLVAWCERIALRYADAVVVTSTYLESLVREVYPKKPILVLSNGVDPKAYKSKSVKKIRNAIYYFGALNRLNLVETLLYSLPETIKQVPDTQVAIIGDGSALDDVKRLVAALDIADHVRFTGWTEAKDLPKYVQAGDIAICMQPDIPTVRAASNLKVFQYMGLSTIPVVSNVGDLPSYVKADQKGKALGFAVTADAADELAETLVATLCDKRGRRRMMERARKAAETEYSWKRLAATLDDFIQANAVVGVSRPQLEKANER